jgi:putative hemolysin
MLGVVNARQLLSQTLRGESPSLVADLQPAVFVPESLTGMELLENFKNTGVHMACLDRC